MIEKNITTNDLQRLEKNLKIELGKLSTKIDSLSKLIVTLTKKTDNIRPQNDYNVVIPLIDSESSLNGIRSAISERLKNDCKDTCKNIVTLIPELTEEEQLQETLRLEQAVNELTKELDAKKI